MKTVFLKGLYILSLVMIPEIVFSSSKDNLKKISPHQYTHLIETYQSQTFEPLSQTALFIEQSASVKSYKTAGVYFITNGKEQVFGSTGNDNTFNDPTGEYCARYGFEVTSCESGLFNKACPYNDKIYDKCCDASYKYTASQCSYPKKLSSDTCGGKYKCLCDTSYYSYAYCDSPKVKGSACTDDSGTYYSSCSCPTGVSAPYGCETYYAGACNKVCKKAKSDNCDNRTAVQTPYGCEKYFTDCASKCEKAYSDNCRNRIAVSASLGCEKYYADCSSKCEVAKTDNCANRTAVSAPYGCKKYYTDCSSKCETAYTDNCHNRTAVSTPNGCESYYADCSSKCEVASKEIKQDIVTGAIVYGDGTVSTAIISGKTPVGIVFDTANRLAVALTNVKKDGSSGSETMKWSNDYYDVPNLANCTSITSGEDKNDDGTAESCGIDGRANTNAILASRDGDDYGGTPTAKACNLYQPTGCAAIFCLKGQWFLPSLRDLNNISLQKSVINATLTLLANKGADTISPYYIYWSSTEGNTNVAWGLLMSGYRYNYNKCTYYGYVRPVVNFNP